jgi:Sensors of blue-light using FAD
MKLATPVFDDVPSSAATDLISLVYVSSAVQFFSSEDLVRLLEQVRQKNGRLGVTGMLLYKGGNFMQALEGSAHVVRDLYAAIARDPRHRAASKLLDSSTKERQFADWTVGFTNLDSVKPIDGTGFTDILNQPLNSHWFSEDASRAQRLLLSFRKSM